MVRTFKALTATLILLFSLIVKSATAQRPVASGTITAAEEGATTLEDWSSPSLAHSHLKSAPAMIAERDTYATFTRELIQVQWRPADPIYLYLILPKGQAKPPVIIYLYSYPSENERFINDEFCKFLAKDGFAAVGFVAALTGQRYHDRPMKEWFVSELAEAIGSSAHDVQMVLNYLGERGDLDMTRVAIFGEGSGAAIAILSAAADPRIKALDLVDPWGDWPDWLAHSTLVPDEERADYLKPEFLKRVAPLDPLRWFGGLKSAVRLQYLSESSVIPMMVSERITAAAPPQTKVIPHEEAVSQYKAAKLKFFDWIKDQLGPASTTSTGRTR